MAAIFICELIDILNSLNINSTLTSHVELF